MKRCVAWKRRSYPRSPYPRYAAVFGMFLAQLSPFYEVSSKGSLEFAVPLVGPMIWNSAFPVNSLGIVTCLGSQQYVFLGFDLGIVPYLGS